MRKRGAAARMALCGVLAALAVALMFLGGTVPFASIACPVLASLVLIPVYCECGWKWGLLWYAAVAALAALLAPEKEAAVLFVFFGYYPMLRKLIGRLRVRAAAWAVKLVYVNAAVFAAYGLMLYVFKLWPSTIIPPLLCGLLWGRISPYAGAPAMVIGGLSYLLWSDKVLGEPFGIPANLVGMGINCLVLFVIHQLMKNRPPRSGMYAPEQL